MGFILKEDMVTYKICFEILAISLSKNNFFWCDCTVRDQLTFVTLLTPTGALSSPRSF